MSLLSAKDIGDIRELSTNVRISNWPGSVSGITGLCNRLTSGQGTLISAMGHKRTLESGPGISALPPKADMLSVEIDVRFVPLADVE